MKTIIDKPFGLMLLFASLLGIELFVLFLLGDRGWFVTRGAEPPCIHLGMLTALHVPIVEPYLRDLQDSVTEVRAGRPEDISREERDRGKVTFAGRLGGIDAAAVVADLRAAAEIIIPPDLFDAPETPSEPGRYI